MGYLAVWKVLEEMVTDFKNKGIPVPAEIIRDLHSAITTIRILGADPSCGENARRVEEYLTNAESYLVSEGQKKFGQAYVDGWLKQRDEASRIADEEPKGAKFVSGLPAEQKWIRLTPSSELPLMRLKALLKKSDLSYKVQTDGRLIVFGPEIALKDFVKKIAARQKTITRKEH
jgi:hypothetical protein